MDDTSAKCLIAYLAVDGCDFLLSDNLTRALFKGSFAREGVVACEVELSSVLF